MFSLNSREGHRSSESYIVSGLCLFGPVHRSTECKGYWEVRERSRAMRQLLGTGIEEQFREGQGVEEEGPEE